MFSDGHEDQLKLRPGQQGSAYFKTGLRKRHLVGNSATCPFQVQVLSSEGNVQTCRGDVEDRALIPVWVIPIVVRCACHWFVLHLSVSTSGSANSRHGAALPPYRYPYKRRKLSSPRRLRTPRLTAGVPTNTPEPTATQTLTETPTDTPEPTATEVPTDTPPIPRTNGHRGSH